MTVNRQESVRAVGEWKDNSAITKVISSPLTQEHVLAKFADVFTGLGSLPGEYHMDIYTTVKAVQAQPRRVAVALKPELEKELEGLERRQVIAKVTTSTEWISSTVVVRKPSGKLRICIDPKDLNRAIQRPHYPILTIAEILPRLANAKIFSVLDAKDGFWQVKLDEQSSYLDAFWSFSMVTDALRGEYCPGRISETVTRSIRRVAWS